MEYFGGEFDVFVDLPFEVCGKDVCVVRQTLVLACGHEHFAVCDRSDGGEKRRTRQAVRRICVCSVMRACVMCAVGSLDFVCLLTVLRLCLHIVARSE